MSDAPQLPKSLSDPALAAAVAREPALETPALAKHRLWVTLLRVALILGLISGVGVFARSLDLRALGRALAHASLWLLALAIAQNFATVFAKSVYWKLGLSHVGPVPLWSMFRLQLASSVASLVAPARAGDAFKIWQAKKLFGVEVAFSLVVIGLEKFGDVLALLLCIAPLPWLLPALPPAVHRTLLLLPLALAAGAAVLVFAARHRGLRGSRFGQRWLRGLSLLGDPVLLAGGFGAILISWLFDVGCICCCMQAVGVAASLGAALLILLLVNLAIAIPLSPGNAGTHELGAALALTLMGVPREQAVAIALLYHGAQALPLLLAGLYDARALLAGKATFGTVRSPP